MKYSIGLAARWLFLAFLVSLVPLGIALIGPLPAPRPFWTEFGVGLGFVGMGLMILQFVASGRFAWVAPRFGADVVLQFHSRTGVIGVILVLAHPVILLLSDTEYLEYFDPRVNFLRALALSFVTVALIAILVTSQWREGVGLNYEWWRLIHGGLSLAIVFVGMVHGIQVSHYLDTLAQKGVWAAVALGAMYLVVHTRVVRPLTAKNRPYRIVDMQEERGNAWSMWLEPDGHPGMDYRAGQYVWFTVGDPPYKLQQHPFSVSAGEDPSRLRLTAAELGDFTSTWKDIEPGTRAYLQGPFGAFTLEPDAPGAVFIVGGIGVTPAMSMLHSLRQQSDSRPAYLFYGNPAWEEVTFREELAELKRELDLTVVHVLEEPPDDWDQVDGNGEEGFIDQELLDKYLPPNRKELNYYICGPTPLMDVAEESLRNLGVSWKRIYTERFEIV